MTLGAGPAATRPPTPELRVGVGPSIREAGIAALLLLAFAPLLVRLAGEWSTREEYGHGFLVPVVSLFALLRERRKLAGLPREGSMLGLVGLLLAILLYAVGTAAGLTVVAGLAFPAALAAAVAWLRGPQWLRALAFPIAFLAFAIPLPESWLAPLVVRLRLFVSEAAVLVLQAASLPVAREGNVLVLPEGSQLFVADACSGVSALVTLTPLAVLLAWFTERGLPRRLVLVAAVLPIALAGNLVRVVGTVLAALRFGPEAATEASAHESLGLLAYVGGCLALLAVAAAMRRLWPPR